MSEAIATAGGGPETPAERAATTKDATLVRKGIKVKEMLRELEETKQRSKEETAALRESLKQMEKQSHDFEIQALRSEGLRSEVESLRKTNDRLMHEKEIEGSLSPTLVKTFLTTICSFASHRYRDGSANDLPFLLFFFSFAFAPRFFPLPFSLSLG